MKQQQAPLQLLLVDDDTQIRLGLEKIIYNHFSEEEISVYSCENGLVASQFLAQEPVDVVITDIKMPLCSGIDLLQIINDKKYTCRSIVLSGYDDFNLVRDAMRLGASDYLLKPVDEGLLIHTLEEMKKAVNRSAAPSPETTSLTSVLKMQRLLESFLKKTQTAAPDAAEFVERYEISGRTPCLMCYVDIKRALYSNHLTLFQFLTDRASTFLHSSEILNRPRTAVLYGGLGSFWIFLVFSDKAFSTPRKLLAPFLTLLDKDHLKYSFTSDWYTYDRILEADAACKKGFEKYYFDLPYKTPEETISRQALSDFMGRAVQAASSYDYAATIENLEHCFSLLAFLRPPISEVKKEMHSFVYSILTRNSSFIPIVSASKFTDYDILEHIETAESLSVLQKEVYASVNYLIGELIRSMQNKDDYVIQKAKEYIHKNYRDDLTLNDVASHVFLNGNYFSTLFKQKTGTTFRNYLRNFRIEKSKELLTTTNLRIYEIALEVGYNEHSHFVRAFKSVTGVSPGQYREEQ